MTEDLEPAGVRLARGTAEPTATPDDGVERARRTYAVGEHPVARGVELRTLGSDFGANGYATLAEVGP